MANIIVPSRRIWTRQPQQAVEIDCSNQFWGGQKPLFLHSQSCGPFDLVHNTPLVVNGAPGRLIGSSGIALSSQSSGISYDGLRVPDVVSGSRSDRLYNKAAPPLTLLTISVANGNDQLSLMRSNGSGSPAFGCGAWYGSNSGGFGAVRTTGGVLSLGPGGFLFDTRVTPIVTIFSIGPTTTRIFSGPIGTMALHVAEAATPTGNFYYEHGDPYRCLSVGGNYNSFAPASWLGAISATEVSSRAAAESLIRNPWQIFRPQVRRSFFDIGAGGGSTLNASAAGAALVSGSATLAAQVALAGVGVAIAGGSAAASVAVPLSAAGLAVAGGSADASATVTISAAGLAQAAGAAGLSAGVLLAGAGAAQAAGNAALAAQLEALAAGAAQASGSANLSASQAGSLAASGSAAAAGDAALSVTVALLAAGAAQAGGSASGQIVLPGSLSASGAAEASGWAAWSALVNVSAAGFVQAMGSGALSVEVPLQAAGGAVAGGHAQLAEAGAAEAYCIQSSVRPANPLLSRVALATRIASEVRCG